MQLSERAEGEESWHLSNPNVTGDQVKSDGQRPFWIWLLAAVFAFALLLAIMKWTERDMRLNQSKPVPSYLFEGPSKKASLFMW